MKKLFNFLVTGFAELVTIQTAEGPVYYMPFYFI